MDKSSCVVIISGGMDSVTLLHLAVDTFRTPFGDHNVEAISFDYNQRHRVELENAASQCARLGVKHTIIDLSCLYTIAGNSALTAGGDVPEGHYAGENMKQTVVPNRNMVMISLALSYATNLKIDNVWYGAHSGDHTIYPDCRPEFLRAMQTAGLLCDWHKVTLDAPFINGDKISILTIGAELGVDYSDTWTCYVGDKETGACGVCGSCVERLEAFAEVGLTDPVHYVAQENV